LVSGVTLAAPQIGTFSVEGPPGAGGSCVQYQLVKHDDLVEALNMYDNGVTGHSMANLFVQAAYDLALGIANAIAGHYLNIVRQIAYAGDDAFFCYTINEDYNGYNAYHITTVYRR
jgi:hypothetical protein